MDISIEDFINRLQEEFEDIPKGSLSSEVVFRDVLEWNSVNALLLMALISTEYDVNISVDELQKCSTINDLYKIIFQKENN